MPDDVKQSMDNWRLAGCWADVPADYQAWQAQLASEELDRIASVHGLEIMNDPRILDEGWMDGMKVMRVTVLTRRQNQVVLEWCDANQGFMKCFGSGGKGALFEIDLT
jgi:hypothetical protein